MSGQRRSFLVAGILLTIAAVGFSVTTLLDGTSGPIDALFRWGLVAIWVVGAYVNFARVFAGRDAKKSGGEV